MKKIILSLVTCLLTSLCAFGQYTPNCTDISGYIVYVAPLTPTQVSDRNDNIAYYYPNAIRLADATTSYNCHNYAWVKRDGGSEFWLNSPGDDQFWNDGSYATTTVTGDAELRVSYQGDHTAVTISSTQCISKWGASGLYQHDTGYVPSEYLPTYALTYYKKTFAISGPSSTCTSDSFSVSLASGETVLWSVSGSGYSISGSSTSASVTINSTGAGNGLLTATVTTSCSTTKVATKALTPVALTISTDYYGTACGSGTASVNYTGGTFSWSVTGDLVIVGSSTGNTISFEGTLGSISVTNSACSLINYSENYQPYLRTLVLSAYQPVMPHDQVTVTVQNIDYNIDQYNWYLNNNLVYSGPSAMWSANEDFSKDGRVCGENTVRVEADLSCGQTVVIGELSFEQLCYSWFRNFVIYPNPSTGGTISVGPDETKTNKNSGAQKAEEKEYNVSIFDAKGKLRLKGKSKDAKISLDTKSLPSDTYFIHITKDGEKEVIKKQIIIRH